MYTYSIHAQPALWANTWVSRVKSLSPLVKWRMLLSTLDISTKLQKLDWVLCLQVNWRQGMNGALLCPPLLLLPLTPPPSPSFSLLLFFMSLDVICPWLVTLIFSNAAYCLLRVILFWHIWTHSWEQVTSVSFYCFIFLFRGRKKD